MATKLKAAPRAKARTTPSGESKRMAYGDVPGFIRAMRSSDGDAVAQDALEWLILTVTKTNATLGARLAEVSEKQAAWTVPAERAETGQPYVVPLSPRALEIFAARRKGRSGKSDLLFEAEPGKALSSAAMLMLMRRLKSAAVPHGFRYSFRAWAIECANGARASKGSLEARRRLFEDWAAFCAGGEAMPRGQRRASR